MGINRSDYWSLEIVRKPEQVDAIFIFIFKWHVHEWLKCSVCADTLLEKTSQISAPIIGQVLVWMWLKCIHDKTSMDHKGSRMTLKAVRWCSTPRFDRYNTSDITHSFLYSYLGFPPLALFPLLQTFPPPEPNTHIIITFTHLADAFIQSDLFRLYIFCQYVFPGNRTHNLLRC